LDTRQIVVGSDCTLLGCTLEVTGGGRINQGLSSSSLIGAGFGVQGGTAKIDGVGSMWDVFFLGIGYEGKGTLDITGGAQVTSSSANVGSVDSRSTGNVKVASTNPGVHSIWKVGQLGIGTAAGDGTLLIQVGGIVDRRRHGAGAQWPIATRRRDIKNVYHLR
jgi:T5SS/PEP-CTERM-associated repeat protein